MPDAWGGSTPKGAQGEVQAASWVRDMFAQIAPRYDLLNHLLSFNIDRGWRKALLASFDSILALPQARILDLCCGTGDVMLDLQADAKGTVMGADFCHPMLVSAAQKSARSGRPARLFEADALNLPLPDDTLDAISVAFGFRNLANYAGGLNELRRVLKPGGLVAILEFSHPPNPIVKAGYNFYSRALLPLIGRAISGSRDAYSYLPESIGKFPQAQELQRMMERAGFGQTRYRPLSGGIAALHTGENSP